jgi:excisionase family DNA binding protein
METNVLKPNNLTDALKAITILSEEVNSLNNLVYQTKEILSLDEAAKFLGCTRSMLYKMTHQRTIPFFKPSGKLVYFEKTELLKWLRQNPVMSQSQIEEEAARHLQKLATN